MSKVYKEVDCDGLATCLAEEAWKIETKNTKEDDLYDTVLVQENGESSRLERQVKPHWANNFFTLRDGYLRIIEYYTKR